MDEIQWTLQSPVGPLHLIATPHGLAGLHFQKRLVPMVGSLESDEPGTQFLRQAARELGEYFAGTRTTFAVPLDVVGSEFQKKVWEQLRAIGFGQTRSYRQIAAQLDCGRAFRAVGTANGKNPLSIIVPCHRVIAADGTLGGYSGGLGNKVKLLALEGITTQR